MREELLLPLLGFAVGALGTLVGAGGGFVLVPVLLFVYPDDPPELITSISLGVVLLNALSGSAAYAHQGRIDYRTGLQFAAAAVPGSILGAWAIRFVSRGAFNVVFGVMMVLIAAFIMLRPTARPRVSGKEKGEVLRTLRDRSGHLYEWAFHPSRGIVLSFFVGFLSSILGIGGGVVHVPVLVMVLNYPIHIATATSQFVLALTAFSGTVTHIVSGEFGGAWGRTVLIGVGVIGGAQLGAALAPRVSPAVITRALATGLALVGVRLLLRAFAG